ncbi:response regulator [Leptothoe sp. PORK10 BA2]|uniref:response regulator n=1 Tax=Leptothoe sp. PORK10 BA2 TaxID=3110254 RepID=UPI002B1F1AEF|nr:response regulator [Leptothoe sp. PORK10 BA2]MEA5467078.1 response regulator [Leptothoe sp. PORK10 BA2]
MAKKILLVEYDEPTYKSLQQYLNHHGYDVVIASDGGDEGIIMAVTESPDLILVATDLPVIDGWQAIKILKASTVTHKIPVIALISPLTTRAEWSKISESSCNDYELKPIEPTNVLDKVNALLNPHQTLEQTEQRADLKQPPCPDSLTATAVPSEVEFLEHGSERTDGIETTVSDKSTVVYIDDSPVDSQIMAEIVRQAGYSYSNITEPLKAIPILLELNPKLIFLDLMMPYTNGYELCARIRRTSTFKNTPIIIVTNAGGFTDRMRARLARASGFFAKPVTEEQVLKVLKKHLAGTALTMQD